MKLKAAFSTLGVEHGSDLSQCKSAFRSKIRQYKNPKSTATQETQDLNTAWNVVQQHYSALENGHSFMSGAFHSNNANGSDTDSDSESYDGNFDGGNSEDDPDILFVYHLLSRHFSTLGALHLAAQLAQQTNNVIIQIGNQHILASKNTFKRTTIKEAPKENYEEMQERKRIAREKEAAEKAARKAQIEEERRLEQEQARRNRAEKKERRLRDRAALQSASTDKLNERLANIQSQRSEAFTAARKFDFDTVKNAIYEKDVTAAGPEFAENLNKSVDSGIDPLTTILHLAAQTGATDFCEWLLNHGAEHSERDSQGMTAFHWTLKNGHASTAALFVRNFPPLAEYNEGARKPPQNKTLLELALESASAETVKVVIEGNLSNIKEMVSQWPKIVDNSNLKNAKSDWSQMLAIFKATEGFKAPKLNAKPVATPHQSAVPASPNVIETLMALGFPRQAAIAALKQALGKVDVAASILLDQPSVTEDTNSVATSGKPSVQTTSVAAAPQEVSPSLKETTLPQLPASSKVQTPPKATIQKVNKLQQASPTRNNASPLGPIQQNRSVSFENLHKVAGQSLKAASPALRTEKKASDMLAETMPSPLAVPSSLLAAAPTNTPSIRYKHPRNVKVPQVKAKPEAQATADVLNIGDVSDDIVMVGLPGMISDDQPMPEYHYPESFAQTVPEFMDFQEFQPNSAAFGYAAASDDNSSENKGRPKKRRNRNKEAARVDQLR